MSLLDELKRNEGFQLFEALVAAANVLAGEEPWFSETISDGEFQHVMEFTIVLRKAQAYLESLPTIDVAPRSAIASSIASMIENPNIEPR